VKRLGQEALACARRTGDAGALAEALLGMWLAVATDPASSEARVLIAREQTEVAGRIADPVLEFHAGLVTFMSGSERGDMAAIDAGLAACAVKAEEVGQPLLRWRAACLRCHRAYIDGRLGDAERWAEEALGLGRAAGQPDAAAFSDVFVIRVLQGLPDEAVELARPLVDAYGDAAAYPTVLAWACAESGRVEEARSLLAGIRGSTFADLRRDYLWLLTTVALGRVAARLADAATAEELYDLLRPHRSDIACGISTWLGPVAYDLGLLATTLGRYDDADSYFAEAAERHRRMGIGGILAHTYLDWARMLLTRHRGGDVERARALLRQAMATARELGLEHIERQAAALASV
jgi:tetratricopeptide (TPR) repeat protein